MSTQAMSKSIADYFNTRPVLKASVWLSSLIADKKAMTTKGLEKRNIS